MSAPKKKPVQSAEEKPLDEQPASQDEQEQPDEAEQPVEAPEPSEEVRKFVAQIRSRTHMAARGKPFEPARGVTLQFGYNGLLRVHGHGHVHVATLDELAEMSDQQVYGAVMAAGKRR